MRVSAISMICMAVTAIVSSGFPAALFIIVRRKFKTSAVPLLTGAAAFILFALVLERQVHLAVLGRFHLRQNPLAYMAYGALMAGIFEETARFLSFHILKKKYRGFSTALSYGTGHGGIEAMLLAGFAMINSIVFSIMINSGMADTITAPLSGAALTQANEQIAALCTAAPYMFLVSGFERLFAIALQLSLSVIVYYSVTSKDKWWLFPTAIALHALADVPAALMQAGVLSNIWVVEGIIMISATALSLLAIFTHKRLKTVAEGE